jgi:hypothetical protein
MKNRVYILAIVTILSLVMASTKTVMALDQNHNNKFGIHLAQPDGEDLKKASELVNSNGGKWGYVTLVIQDNDRDKGKWEGIFDQLRELHLIPIIRLATHPEGGNWARPNKVDADGWASFLESLNWVVKERYVVLFNETNHGTEWGGWVDSGSYAEVAKEFAKSLKDKSPDFKVMLAGFDASAPQASPRYADEATYLKEVVDKIGVDDFNKLFDGLSSHSYPNPGFAGSPYGQGRGTVRTYDWELGLLKSWGVKDLPVFITETGWDGNVMSRFQIAQNFQNAYEQVWLPDDRVVAVTPFVLNYQGDPFLGFSWAKLGNSDYHPQYAQVEGLEKKPGDPEQIQKGTVKYELPSELVVNSSYHFKVFLHNEGQAVWDSGDGYNLVLDGMDNKTYFFSDLNDIKPGDKQEVDLYMKTDRAPGTVKGTISLYKNSQKILTGDEWNVQIVPLPSLKLKVTLYPRLITEGDDFELQLFDEREQLVFRKKVSISKGVGTVESVNNIALGRKYRAVLLKPYYLPRQTYVLFQKGINDVKFERMYPIDFNKDGHFDINDIGSAFTQPDKISLYFP